MHNEHGDLIINIMTEYQYNQWLSISLEQTCPSPALHRGILINNRSSVCFITEAELLSQTFRFEIIARG